MEVASRLARLAAKRAGADRFCYVWKSVLFTLKILA